MITENASLTPYTSLTEVIKRINADGYKGNVFHASTTIQRICESLRETQRNSRNRQNEFFDNKFDNGEIKNLKIITKVCNKAAATKKSCF